MLPKWPNVELSVAVDLSQLRTMVSGRQIQLAGRYPHHTQYPLSSTYCTVQMPATDHKTFCSQWGANTEFQANALPIAVYNSEYKQEKSVHAENSLLWPGASQWRIYYHRMWVQLSTTRSNVLKQHNCELLVAVNHNQLRTMASETVDPIDWLHPPPSWAVSPEHHVHSINQCNLSGTWTCNRSMWGNQLAYASTQGKQILSWINYISESDKGANYALILNMHLGAATSAAFEISVRWLNIRIYQFCTTDVFGIAKVVTIQTIWTVTIRKTMVGTEWVTFIHLVGFHMSFCIWCRWVRYIFLIFIFTILSFWGDIIKFQTKIECRKDEQYFQNMYRTYTIYGLLSQ